MHDAGSAAGAVQAEVAHIIEEGTALGHALVPPCDIKEAIRLQQRHLVEGLWRRL